MFQSANFNFIFLRHWMLCCLLNLVTKLTVLQTRRSTESNIHSLHLIKWKYVLILITHFYYVKTAMRFIIHELVLCTKSIFLENIRFESYHIESSYIRVMVRRERRFQYRLPIANSILVTLIKKMREEKKTDSKYGRNIRSVCVNSIQGLKENRRSRVI